MSGYGLPRLYKSKGEICPKANRKILIYYFKRGQFLMQKDKTPADKQPVTLLKRIGSTTVEVIVHFSNTDNETLEDKLLRLMEREVNKSA